MNALATLAVFYTVIFLALTSTKGLGVEPRAEHTPGKHLVCLTDPWSRTVRVIDSNTSKMLDEIFVGRPPVAAAITYDGRYLLVADHLPSGKSDGAFCTTIVNLVELTSGETVKELYLPNGSTAVKELKISPDGKYAAVTHVLGQFQQPTIHLRRNWMVGNALTVIDLTRLEVLGSVLLDDRGRGGGNPWGLGWTDDGKILVVAHSGTHEVSVIDFLKLVEKIMELPAPVAPTARNRGVFYDQTVGVTGYAPLFPGARRRIKLPEGDLGPRELAIIGRVAYVTNYFSGTVTVIDLDDPAAKPKSMPGDGKGQEVGGRSREEVLGAMSLERRGEFYFHDASICFQGWQSCASCHPGGARADGLNWDLLNDGFGNPKNTKSLLLAFETPPAMSTGVRESAHEAVRAGLKHILFTEPKEEIATAIEAYIRSLKPVPSPYLVHGELSPGAMRGQKVFAKAGCSGCHPGPLYTDLNAYDVGTRGPHDRPEDKFDTPTLVEIWRTAPYLHDGSAATVRDVITMRNLKDEHGTTSGLSSQEIDDLCEYLLSL